MPEGSTSVPLISLLVSGCTGGLMGALLTAYVNSYRQKTDLAIRLIEQFIAKHKDFAICFSSLKHEPQKSVEHSIGLILELADWSEIVALLCSGKHTNNAIIETSGLLEILSDFYFAIRKKSTVNHTLREKVPSYTNLKALAKRVRKSKISPPKKEKKHAEQANSPGGKIRWASLKDR